MLRPDLNHHRKHAIDLQGNGTRAYRQLLHSTSSSTSVDHLIHADSTPCVALRVHRLALICRIAPLVAPIVYLACPNSSPPRHLLPHLRIFVIADSARTCACARHYRTAIHPRKPRVPSTMTSSPKRTTRYCVESVLWLQR